MLTNLLPLKKIEKIFDIKVKDKSIWLEAIIHRSWLYYHPEYKINDNERLEFLGDAILQAIVSFYIYQKFRNLSEGDMSLLRASLVNRERLSNIAVKINLEEILYMNHKIDEKGKKTILGNSLEAVIAALFLDQGLEVTKNFVERVILDGINEIVQEKSYKDPKTILQELFQLKYTKVPIYKVVEIKGPPHKQKFKVEVYLDDKKIGEGEGDSRQNAEFDAAKKIILKEKIL